MCIVFIYIELCNTTLYRKYQLLSMVTLFFSIYILLYIVDTERCHPTQPFRCPGKGTVCISIQYLCDGAPDCPDGYDEHAALCTAGE